MKKHFFTIIATTLATIAFAESATSPTPIWTEGKMPGVSAPEYKLTKKRNMIAAIKTPTLELFPVKSDKHTPFVIVCPGGGYSILAHEHEGVDIAKWLNKNGISAGILRYRVPQNPQGALQDIQRAIRLVRKDAEKNNIAPTKIGIIGFSAGANLCARAATNFDKESYKTTDETDSLSARPDFVMLIYPAYCDKPGNDKRWKRIGANKDADYNEKYELADNLDINKNTPPTFIAQSLDDKSYINAAIAYFLAAKENGVSVNLHIFGKGGHGYGLAKSGSLPSAWSSLAIKWIDDTITEKSKK